MATKKQERFGGCWDKAAEDEPLFVLRGQDMLAPALVREWARQFAVHAAAQDIDAAGWLPKFLEAMQVAHQMEQWPGRRLPD